jgi:hypothetical protein
MTAFYGSLATLLINYIIYLYPGIALGIICAYLFGSHCFEYLRERRLSRILKQLTDGNMDCKYRAWATREELHTPNQRKTNSSSRCA